MSRSRDEDNDKEEEEEDEGPSFGPHELLDIMHRIGQENFTLKDSKEMLNEFDYEGDNEIDMEEFFIMLRNN